MKKYLIFISFILLQFNNCRGCDCNIIVGMNKSKNVFIGRVINIVRISSPIIKYKITFKILKNYKSKFYTKTVKITVPSLTEGGCGFDFKTNDIYLIYSYLEDKELYTDACTKSRKLK